MKGINLLRAMVRGAYDIQEMRMQAASRFIINWKAKILGQSPGMPEEALDDDSKWLLSMLRLSSPLLSDAIVNHIRGTADNEEDVPVDLEEENTEGLSSDERAERDLKAGRKPKELNKKIIAWLDRLVMTRYMAHTEGKKKFPNKEKFRGDAIISSYTELCMIAEYVGLMQHEKMHFKHIESIVEDYPIYTEYLTNICGIAHCLSAILISEFNINDPVLKDSQGRVIYQKDGVTPERKTLTPSSMWKYAGLDVAPDGAGRSKRTAHLIDVAYIDKKGEPKLKKSITYNDWLKTKLLGVLGPCLLKSRNVEYTKLYKDKRNFYDNHPVYGEKNDGKKCTLGLLVCKSRRHKMALRYMVKQFLVELYKNWRKLEGLPVKPSYFESKYGPHNSPHPVLNKE